MAISPNLRSRPNSPSNSRRNSENLHPSVGFTNTDSKSTDHSDSSKWRSRDRPIVTVVNLALCFLISFLTLAVRQSQSQCEVGHDSQDFGHLIKRKTSRQNCVNAHGIVRVGDGVLIGEEGWIGYDLMSSGNGDSTNTRNENDSNSDESERTVLVPKKKLQRNPSPKKFDKTQVAFDTVNKRHVFSGEKQTSQPPKTHNGYVPNETEREAIEIVDRINRERAILEAEEATKKAKEEYTAKWTLQKGRAAIDAAAEKATKEKYKSNDDKSNVLENVNEGDSILQKIVKKSDNTLKKMGADEEILPAKTPESQKSTSSEDKNSKEESTEKQTSDKDEDTATEDYSNKKESKKSMTKKGGVEGVDFKWVTKRVEGKSGFFTRVKVPIVTSAVKSEKSSDDKTDKNSLDKNDKEAEKPTDADEKKETSETEQEIAESVKELSKKPLYSHSENTVLGQNTEKNDKSQISQSEKTTPNLSTDTNAARMVGWKSVNVYLGDSNLNDGMRRKYSQAGQDRMVAKLLGCKRDGYFLDLAANDAVQLSNTRLLERDMGWNGLCIEANEQYQSYPIINSVPYWYKLAQRKCTVAGAIAGGKTNEDMTFVKRAAGAAGGMAGFDNKKGKKSNVAEIRRKTVDVWKLLADFNVPRVIDYLSLDLEGAEWFVMQHFPFYAFTIKVLTIERPPTNLQQLLKQHGYSRLGKLGGFGDETWVHDESIPGGVDEAKAEFKKQIKRGLTYACGLGRPVPNAKVETSKKTSALNFNQKSNALTISHDILTPAADNGGWGNINVFVGDGTLNDVDRRVFSQNGQDFMISKILGCKKKGYFVDLAASDPVMLSNTRLLERDLEWEGLCVEANEEFWHKLSHRKCKLAGAIAGPKNNEPRSFVQKAGGGIEPAGLAQLAGAEIIKSKNGKKKKTSDGKSIVTRQTVEVGKIFKDFNVPKKFDYLSLDLEGAEWLIMQSFPWEKYIFNTLSIERPQSELRSKLKKFGYVKLGSLGDFGEETWVHTSIPGGPEKALLTFKEHYAKPAEAGCPAAVPSPTTGA